MIEKLPIADKALPGEKDKTKSPFPHKRNEDFFFDELCKDKLCKTLLCTRPQAKTPTKMQGCAAG